MEINNLQKDWLQVLFYPLIHRFLLDNVLNIGTKLPVIESLNPTLKPDNQNQINKLSEKVLTKRRTTKTGPQISEKEILA